MFVALIGAPVSNNLGQPVSVAANTNPASRFSCEWPDASWSLKANNPAPPLLSIDIDPAE